jgi:hypothetical protein
MQAGMGQPQWVPSRRMLNTPFAGRAGNGEETYADVAAPYGYI